MGWETVEHCCGHQVDHQLYGNRAWRARQAERLAQELCPDCKQAERDKENRKAAEANVEAGYPPLEGTEKQIAWAETIRHDMLAVAEAVDEAWSTVRDDNQSDWKQVLRKSGQPFVACENLLRNAVKSVGGSAREAFMRALCEQTKASWWIDHRGNYYDVVQDIAAQIKADAPDKEDSLVAREAKQEAILRPEDEVVCDTVIELALAGGVILVKPPEKRDDFQGVMRATGCKWDADRRRYVFRPGRHDGDILDRMAEITHALVAAGFLVSLFDAEARRRALEHDFTPRQTRWIGVDGEWLTITWSRPDDFYESARSLPGSRYKDGRVLVPTSMVEDVADWAEENGFALDPAVTAYMDKRREALVNAIVLRNPKAAKKGVTGYVQEKPEELQTPSESSIDEELRDDD